MKAQIIQKEEVAANYTLAAVNTENGPMIIADDNGSKTVLSTPPTVAAAKAQLDSKVRNWR